MSCMLLAHNDYRNLAHSLISLAFDCRMMGMYNLKGFLQSMSPKGYVDDGAKAVARLLYVANYRAFNVRYEGRHLEGETFESMKHHLSRPRNCDWHPKADFAQLVATCKFVHCAIYQCMEDGEKVKCHNRKMWKHFLELKRILDGIVLENTPEYNSAPWGDMNLVWEERYKAS